MQAVNTIFNIVNINNLLPAIIDNSEKSAY